MCGIIGYCGKETDAQIVVSKLQSIAHRGRDCYGLTDGKRTITGSLSELSCTQWKSTFFIAHALHAIVDFLPQPFENCFAANCEIYNWQQLAKKYSILAKNDAALLYLLLQKKGIHCLKELDGDYAFIWNNGESMYAVRDIMGVKPLWLWNDENNLWFASENKALKGNGVLLDPRVCIEIKANNVISHNRPFFAAMDVFSSPEEIREKVGQKLTAAVRKRVSGLDKVAILFSGGVDSTLLAVLAKRYCCDVTLYTAGLPQSEDVIWAARVAAMLSIPHKTYVCGTDEIETEIKEVIRIIETADVMKVGVALPFHLACTLAARDGHKVILSGLGSEELFAGYHRHKKAEDVNKECYNGLLKMHERDLYRDDTITMAHHLELRVPFLDDDLIECALSIPAAYKLTDGVDKAILREAAVQIGVPPEVAYRKKRAAQYGSGMDKAVAKLAKRNGYMTKRDYLSLLQKSVKNRPSQTGSMIEDSKKNPLNGHLVY